ncbi:hypothetical protein MKK70_11615 [Methylobacterium sp. E-041]|uniref:hypothetical protein n=1 Tax=Methylobacterium sp. E-041 TaxID=2836573 RepID=UPI001FBB1E68|nr:hypothetical protein [Methylobacterium sp. E-041]MCJ2106009.1 hypothetical protein [Methylobacterium sp. E-041]
MRKTIVITGGDEKFYNLMMECILSLNKVGIRSFAEIGVLNQGLSEHSCSCIKAMGIKIANPEWPDFVPSELRNNNQIGLVSRPYLRDLFPGYDIYLWFDADAWAQNSDFYNSYIEGAAREGAAVALENGAGYRKSWREMKWWAGNYISAYGLKTGLNLSFKNSINIGILALKNDAAHWGAWTAQYKSIIDKTGKLNLDQHAFHAAIHLNGFRTKLLPARMNWLPILSAPLVEKGSMVLREPSVNKEVISIIHLAGPDKERTYNLKGGLDISTSLTYNAYNSLYDSHHS